MKEIKDFENYSIKQDGSIINSKTKKELKPFEKNKIKLTKNRKKYVFNIDELIESHFNAIIFKEFIGMPIKDKYVRITIKDQAFLLVPGHKLINCDTLETFDFLEMELQEEEKIKVKEIWSDNFPNEVIDFIKGESKIIIDGVTYKALEENPAIAISKDNEFFLIEDGNKLDVVNGKIKLKLNGLFFSMRVSSLYQKYFG